MKIIFAGLGAAVSRHRFGVIMLWLAATMVGAWAAAGLPSLVVGGSGALDGSQSQRMAETLRSEFDNPFTEPLVIALSSRRYNLEDPEFRKWIAAAREQLLGLAEVRQVFDYTSSGNDGAPNSIESRRALLLVALHATTVEDQERAVPAVRSALNDLKSAMKALDPAARLAVTGQAAITVDINDINREDGNRTERQALPLTLLVLLLSFGALTAAALPLAMGVAATTIALGLAWLLAHVMPVSNLLQNVVTMLGLALGIDYSLLMVSRFREVLPAHDPGDAVVVVLAECGGTIAGSGLTVMIGLLGLLFSPLLETRSIGIGGALVVFVAAFAALTLLPALLVVLGRRIDWPYVLSHRLSRGITDRLWQKLAAAVVRRPLLIFTASVAIVVAIALPGLQAHSGFDNSRAALPVDMESRVGADILAEMGKENLTLPVNLVLRAEDSRTPLGNDQLNRLAMYAHRLSADARIAAIIPPLTPMPPAPALAPWLSHDRSALLLRVIPATHLDLEGVQRLARDLAVPPPGLPFSVGVGGPAVYYNDYARLMKEGFVRVFAFVVIATLILLFVVFRSWLLPVKAVLTNLLAVAAGYGAVVAMFQFGWFASLAGVDHLHTAIPLVVPLLCFCLCFGMSMDYEVFLLRRIQAGYARSGDNTAATAEGLIATGPVISSAALIMVVVFGAFVGTELALLKMIGVGLTVTVLVDATLIRCLLVPAAMCLAGRWNWLPGYRSS